MLSNAECHKQAHYAECRYAEYRGALPLDIVLPASVHAKRISHLSTFSSFAWVNGTARLLNFH